LGFYKCQEKWETCGHLSVGFSVADLGEDFLTEAVCGPNDKMCFDTYQQQIFAGKNLSCWYSTPNPLGYQDLVARNLGEPNRPQLSLLAPPINRAKEFPGIVITMWIALSLVLLVLLTAVGKFCWWRLEDWQFRRVVPSQA
jgi:hypothetical protein